MADEKSVAEQVEEITSRWNPPPTDRGFERVVGVTPEPGDTRATAHVPMDELNQGFQPASSSVDASRPDLYTDDGDDGEQPDIDDVTKEELQDRLREQGKPVSGSKQDLYDRLYEEDDEEEDDEE